MTDCIEATQKPGPNGYVYLTVAGAKVYARRFGISVVQANKIANGKAWAT